MPRGNPRLDLPRPVYCYLCGMPLQLMDPQLDHVIPKSRGGRDGVGNRFPGRVRHQEPMECRACGPLPRPLPDAERGDCG